MLGLLLSCSPLLMAQAPTQEVVLSTSAGSKLGIAVSAPQVAGVAEDLVKREFHEVLLRDLEEAGPFAVLRDVQPKPADATGMKAWMEAGTDWLVAIRVGRPVTEGSDKISKPIQDEVEVVAQVTDVKSSKAVFSKRYRGKEAALRRIAHSLSDDLVARLTGEKGVAGTRIVFVRQLTPLIKEVFQIDRDGSNTVQLTTHKSLTLSPTVAADGRIAYMTYKGGPPEIWGQRKVGGPFEKLFPTKGGPQGPCMAPAWSPDGQRIVFVQGDRRGNTDIMVLDVESGRVRRITDSNCINTEPTWNPGGTQIAFTSDREGTPQVYLMEEDGSNVRRLTMEGTYNASPSWSPTGAMIAYVSRFEGKFDLFVHKLGEGKSYQITTGVASSESPSWSPDERRLVFSSGSRGGMQLYTTDLSGNTLRRLSDFAGCQSPKWTRSR
jgi:TolB protein